LTIAEKNLRATRPGVAGRRAEEFKRSYSGTAGGRANRGDNLPMVERCRQQQIHFWPVAIEVDGAITPSFLRFFKNVCNAAKNLTGQNHLNELLVKSISLILDWASSGPLLCVVPSCAYLQPPKV
jgi:hypothetical protein